MKIKLIAKNEKGKSALEKLKLDKNNIRQATISNPNLEPYTLVYTLNKSLSKKMNILGNSVAESSARIMLKKVLKKHGATIEDCELIVE